MDRSRRIAVGLTVALGIAAGAAVRPPAAALADQNVRERAQDRAQIRSDRAELSRDVADVRRLERLLWRLDDARRRFDEPVERRVRQEIHAFLAREMGDAKQQVAKDCREARQSARELRRDRRRGRPGWDDRRDLRDDVWDLATSKGRLAREREIIFELHALQPRISHNDRAAEGRERELFQEFLNIARRDAAATGRELGEDRRELTEDRREHREERR